MSVATQAGPRLRFAVEGVEAVKYAAVPTLGFALRVESSLPVRSVMLQTQLRIAVPRRSHDRATQERLVELFGPPEAWKRTLRSLLWATLTTVVPPFEGSTVVEIPVTCTYDFEVSTARYLDAVRDGQIPLELLFSGTVLYADDGALRISQISWEEEATYALPVAEWRRAMDDHFPGGAWLRLDRERFDRLAAYRARGLHMGWDATVDALLDQAEGQHPEA